MVNKPRGDEPEVDATHLISKRIGHTSGAFLGQLRVKPQDQERMILGTFTVKDNLKGFCIDVKPNPDPDDSVVTHIINAGTDDEYKLLLHIINYGSKTITASIRQL
jgi:hypothetical protein